MKSRKGFTLWELTMVLLVLSVAATLAAPAFARLGKEQPPTAGAELLKLLHDTRAVAIDHNVTAILRIDPKRLEYRVDTIGLTGTDTLATGTLDLGMGEAIETDLPRLQYLFRPTGAAFADSAAVRTVDGDRVVRVDPWSGIAHVDSL